MKPVMKAGITLALLALGGTAVPSFAQLGGGGLGGGLGGGYGGMLNGRPHSARMRYEELQNQLKSLIVRSEAARARVEKGSAPQADLDELLEQTEQVRLELASVSEQAGRETVVDQLQRPINITLKDATIRQAAAALSKATQFEIAVDERLPQDLRVSMDVKRVPLGTVLQFVARQMNIMLAPLGKPWHGVEISPWPTLTVGDQQQTFVGPYAPWSDEWGGLPVPLSAPINLVPSAVAAAPGPKPPTVEATPALGPVAEAPLPAPTASGEGTGFTGGFGAGMPGGMSGMMGMPGGFPMGMPGMPMPVDPAFSLTSPSPNLLVVAEPGAKDGGSGVYLTVYRIEGGQLKRTGSLFHRFTSQQPGSMMPGMPGMMGGSNPFGGASGGGGFGGGISTGTGSFPAGGGGGLSEAPQATPSAFPPGGGGAAPARPAPTKPRPKEPLRNRRN